MFYSESAQCLYHSRINETLKVNYSTDLFFRLPKKKPISICLVVTNIRKISNKFLWFIFLEFKGSLKIKKQFEI